MIKRVQNAITRVVACTAAMTMFPGVAGASIACFAGAGLPRAPGYPAAEEGLEAWINVAVIQKLTHHTSAVIAAVVLFWLVGFVVQRLLHDSWIKRCVLLFDEFVLLCLFVYFAYELFSYLLAAHRA